MQHTSLQPSVTDTNETQVGMYQVLLTKRHNEMKKWYTRGSGGGKMWILIQAGLAKLVLIS
jgi:hypothetical protein